MVVERLQGKNVIRLNPSKLKPKEGKGGERGAIKKTPKAKAPEPKFTGDPVALLDDICASLADHLVIPEHADVAITLWCAFTHAMGAWQCAPMIGFVAPDRECGKSTALSAVEILSCNAMSCGQISGPAVYRLLDNDAQTTTLLIDEIDKTLGQYGSTNMDLRQVLLTGHTREKAFVIKCIGDEHEAKQLRCWGPKAFAGIGRGLPDDVMSRSIVVEMRRKDPRQKLRRLRDGRLGELAPELAAMMRGLAPLLTNYAPQGMPEVGDRDYDNWEPLIAIADRVGGSWPERARAACEWFCSQDRIASIGEMLLQDIRDVFEANTRVDRISSEDLANKLAALEGHPWADCYRGKPITKDELARRLKPYGVSPHYMRIPLGERAPGKSRAIRGYERSMFEDVWRLYTKKPVVEQ